MPHILYENATGADDHDSIAKEDNAALIDMLLVVKEVSAQRRFTESYESPSLTNRTVAAARRSTNSAKAHQLVRAPAGRVYRRERYKRTAGGPG